MSEPQVGQWVVIGRGGDYNTHLTFDCAQVTRVTKALVYADAHYRTQHPRDNATVMKDEAAARLFVERAKSAYAEAARRQRAAWSAYDETIGKLLKSAQPPVGESAR